MELHGKKNTFGKDIDMDIDWFKNNYLELINNKKSYKEMIDFCCGGDCIVNNRICECLMNMGISYEIYTGDLNNNEYGILQYFIVSNLASEELQKRTNETVIYFKDADLYLLCVTHYGTDWDYVPANWKRVEEYLEQFE